MSVGVAFAASLPWGGAVGAIAARQAAPRQMAAFSVDCRDCLVKGGLGMIKKIESYPELADPQLQPRYTAQHAGRAA
jgi:hypothetical protein